MDQLLGEAAHPAKRSMVPMQTRVPSIHASIASRVAAILLTTFPLAAFTLTLERQDQAAFESLRTYEELRAYVAYDVLGSYWACFGIIVCAGFGYVAMVEGIAFLLRAAFSRNRRSADQPSH